MNFQIFTQMLAGVVPRSFYNFIVDFLTSIRPVMYTSISTGRAVFISVPAFFIFFAADLVDHPNVLRMFL